MKKILISYLFLLFVSQTTALYAQQGNLFDDRPKITVSGEAVVNVTPDIIIVNFGIENSDKDILAAKSKNNELMKAVISAMKELGIADKNIQTDYLSIEPRWDNSYKNRDFIGYFVRNTIAVTISDPSKVEELVTKALQSGVNYIHGIDFQTSEFKKYREQARELALKAAKEKADNMAAVLGQTVGIPLYINEYGSPSRYWSNWSESGYGRSSQMSQNVMVNQTGSGDSAMEGLALGKISVRANVSVTFEINNKK